MHREHQRIHALTVVIIAPRMCFSATASFVTSGVLTATGGIVVAKKPARRERLFAAIPWLFAVQQGIEGVQWMLMKSGNPSTVLGYGFLFFAFLLWPTYIPLAVYTMERKRRHKVALLVFLVAGIVASAYLLIALLRQPLALTLAQRSIRYGVPIPYGDIGVFGYAFIVCGCLLIASDKHLRLFGLLMAAAFVASYFVFQYALTSVWCFFAAALSVIVVIHFLHPHRSSRRG